MIAFLLGFTFSFLGSIPPGTLNMLVLQIGLEHRIKAGLRFALAVALVEYPYAWIGVQFEQAITSSPLVLKHLKLWGALIMTVFGLISLWSVRKPTTFTVKFQQSGFRRGLVLSLLNPQAIPFWIMITAYLKNQGWLQITTTTLLHSYLLGSATGSLALLSSYVLLAHRVAQSFNNNRMLRMLPGSVLLFLGIFGFIRYLIG